MPGDTLCAFLMRGVDAQEADDPHRRRKTLLDEAGKATTPEFGLLGVARTASASGAAGHDHVFLNTHDPFCFVTLGVQGSGKSHSLGVVMENCLLQLPAGAEDALRLHRPMSTVVFHFDPTERTRCEALGIVSFADDTRAFLADGAADAVRLPALPRDKMLVLVSPSNYLQRRAQYPPDIRVVPLLFSWNALTAKQIKSLMRISDGDNQLYVSTLLAELRRFQREGKRPTFEQFWKRIEDTCTVKGQNGPLLQRRALLEALVEESAANKELRGKGGGDLSTLLEEGMLVIADLSDPLLSPDEASGVFEVLLEQFRGGRVGGNGGGGKLLVLDEAHRYVSGNETDGLSRSIVETVRLMRHEGMRVAISTQSPKVLAPELLELVSLLFVHRSHSEEWYSFLKSKIPLPSGGFETVQDMPVGQALVFADSHAFGKANDAHPAGRTRTFQLAVRARLTRDHGASVSNTPTPAQSLLSAG
jgi:hypothetical protein